MLNPYFILSIKIIKFNLQNVQLERLDNIDMVFNLNIV